MWVYGDEPKPSKMARERSASKRMIALFNRTGHVATVTLENCRTVLLTNARSYWLTPKNNCKRRIVLHHDNASSKTDEQTNKFSEEKNVKLMSNPAYSPDLAPCDFVLFAKN
ncbi:hypothetical protein EVAR_18388_1 [Eumeta japonica]|uniref:Mariner Mos1 transposase n=1 Tax=Eumeta variegata TaxID=151549 RepID=A0A4C1UTZ1_EUMVA|nr:hypothetical protein EVAR_18388_1 [Eumeta japonica]